MEGGPWQNVLIQVIQLNLCPESVTENIPEYVALRECLRRGSLLGWPNAVCLQTWIVLQGIRGEAGVQVAAEIIGIGVPSWHVEAYCDAFCDAWLARYATEVEQTGRVAVLGHEEGLAQGMTGHHFVEALRCGLQRRRVILLAQKLEAYKAECFGPKEVLEIKRHINDSGLELRLATATKLGAGLASGTGYNAMNWTRCFSLLMRELHGAAKFPFTENMWKTMLQCQGGHDVTDALAFFGVQSVVDANYLLEQCPKLTWEVLFVALCESRQAWQHFKDGGALFSRIVTAVDEHPFKHTRTIRRLTHWILKKGAEAKRCFSTRLFLALSKKILQD